MWLYIMIVRNHRQFKLMSESHNLLSFPTLMFLLQRLTNLVILSVEKEDSEVQVLQEAVSV